MHRMLYSLHVTMAVEALLIWSMPIACDNTDEGACGSCQILLTVPNFCQSDVRHLTPESNFAADKQQQQDELSALEAIYGGDCVIAADHTTCQVPRLFCCLLGLS